jgi:tRNA nucleotidyltransferase (CCA-adding enzyme)
METTFYHLRTHPKETRLSALEIDLTIRIAEATKIAGGRALAVGGYPRDIVMGKQPKDIDLEIYGLDVTELEMLLEPIHSINKVGAFFGVFKVGPLDVSLPRRESKAGTSHRDFKVAADPFLPHKEAARRRDFTINAMALDPLNGEFFDEYRGRDDITLGLLRAVDLATFGDDPLRGLRAMQFAGRFGFIVETKTAELIRNFDVGELSDERIGEEWTKLLLKSEKPSHGLAVARDLSIIAKLHPELAALIDALQEPAWHPEASVWNQTLLVVDVAAKIVRREKLTRDEALTVMFSALCHDFGKPSTITMIDGRTRSPEQAKAGVELARKFMERLYVPQKIVKKVEHIVFDHMFLTDVKDAKDAVIRCLAHRLYPATIQELIWVTEAAFWGRELEVPDTSIIELFRKHAKELKVDKAPLAPLVKGKDLLALGVKPGPKMGTILKELETAQINGAFGTREEGVTYITARLNTYQMD